VLVALVGIDGCGKSTQADRLREHWEASGSRVRATEVWDVLADPTLDTSFTGGADALRGYLGQISSSARCLFVFHALVESFRRAEAAGADVLLATGFVPKYSVVEELLGTPRPLLDALATLFPRPDVTLWLDLDPAEAAARREAYTRYECGGADPAPEAFTAFQGRCRELLATRAEAEDWVRVDASGSPDEVAARLVEALGASPGAPPREAS
jgi:dTMP kinase